MAEVLAAMGWAALGWVAGIGANGVVSGLMAGGRPWGPPRAERESRLLGGVTRDDHGPDGPAGPALPWRALSLLGRGGLRPAEGWYSPPAWSSLEPWLAVTFGLFALSLLPEAGLLSLLVHSLYAALLWIVLMVDWRTRYVYNRITYPALVAALLLTSTALSQGPLATLLGFAVGAAALGAFYLLGLVLYGGRAPLGFGDVTIAGLVGAMTAFPGVVLALIAGTLGGAVLALALLAAGAGRRAYMPYGPALCLGALATMLVR